MQVPINYLQSADYSAWTDIVSKEDSLPARPSGPWIERKHKLLTYYADLFATGMKNKWESRVYRTLFRTWTMLPSRHWTGRLWFTAQGH